MRALLFIIASCFAINFSVAQSHSAVSQPAACDAAFSYFFDPLNPMVVHFQDQSSGQITQWTWSFGDGSTMTGQNQVHTYAQPGTYFVCLTVSNADPGNPCHDFLCLAITIHEPGACVADYSVTKDPGDPFLMHFTDKSSGNINRWHWVFGDGTSSDDRNPSHQFASSGKFRVCLTSYNVDSLSTCNDTKCDSIRVGPSADCHASFSSELDSLNPAPNTYIFRSTSSGNPNVFLWKIDNGPTYNSPVIKHQFQVQGQHDVCLLVKKVVDDEIRCTDSICHSIITEKYFDIGGHLFTGNFPINNPVSTGDTGIAYLFRMDESRLIPYDTTEFTYLGYYAFPKKLQGTYVVKAGLTPGSVNYSQFFPGYYQESIHWKGGTSLNLTENNAFASDIHLIPANDSLSGPAGIRGVVVAANSKDQAGVIRQAEVILFDAQLRPMRFIYSGESGQFELNNLPYGAYYLYVEYPGKYSRLTAVWLDQAKPVATDIVLEVFDHDVTSIGEGVDLPALVSNLFPNPATSDVNLTIDLVKATSLKFEIRTLTGIVLWSGSSAMGAGSNVVTIPVGSIRPGLYLFVIQLMNGSPVGIKKLVRN